MILVGIDPGLHGGIAWRLQPLGIIEYYSFAELRDLELANLIRRINKTGEEAFVYMEKLGAMPAKFRGSSVSWTLAEHVGKLKMALAVHDIPYEEVPPQKWQKGMGCFYGRKKNSKAGKAKKLTYAQRKKKLMAKAQALFPKVHVSPETADALLIYEYARRTYK